MSRLTWWSIIGNSRVNAQQNEELRNQSAVNVEQERKLREKSERLARIEEHLDMPYHSPTPAEVVEPSPHPEEEEVNPLDAFMQKHPRTGKKIVSGMERVRGFLKKRVTLRYVIAQLIVAFMSAVVTVPLLPLLALVYPSWTTAIIFHLALFLFLSWRLRRSALKD